MLFRTLLLLCLLSIGQQLAAQLSHRALRRGDTAYEQKDFNEARKQYEGALDADNSAKGNYNLGNTYYEQGDYEAAAKRYEEAAGLSDNQNVRNSAYRNLGDAYFQQQEYEKSVDAYKNSLRINPDDTETKHNLSMALREIRKQQEEQNQQNNQDQQDQGEQEQQEQDQQQSGQGDPQDQQGDQQGQEQENEGQQQDQGQEQEQQQAQNGGQSQADPSKAPKMSREEAERQLGIAAEAEKETMSRIQAQNQSGCNSTKEW